MTKIVIASPHARHDALAAELAENSGIEVVRIRASIELSLSVLSDLQPRYIFFPHWSWKIPEEVYENFECVIFHMTDLPFGRGGSPLQNLLVRNIYETQLTALRCVGALDAGSIYLKQPLSLWGTAEEILLRAAQLSALMIRQIIEEQPIPQPQVGEVTMFRRRTPDDGNLAEIVELEKAFDHIRMLDADGYPPAFLETTHFRIEFSRASLKPDAIHADVKIFRRIP
jgi:methionyl-tRNA formyltransferase